MKEQNLQLSLKRQWFELTKSGVKREDYREITPYWALRLFNKKHEFQTIDFWKGFLGGYYEKLYGSSHYYGFQKQESIDYVISEYGFKPFTHNIMTLGYPKSTDTDRILKLEHKGIEIRTGVEAWGAEPNKLYFVIKHGEIL